MEKVILKLVDLYENEVKNSFAHLNELHEVLTRLGPSAFAIKDANNKLAGMNELMKKRDERIKVLEGQLADYLDRPEVKVEVLEDQSEEIESLIRVKDANEGEIEKLRRKLQKAQDVAKEQAEEVERSYDRLTKALDQKESALQIMREFDPHTDLTVKQATDFRNNLIEWLK